MAVSAVNYDIPLLPTVRLHFNLELFTTETSGDNIEWPRMSYKVLFPWVSFSISNTPRKVLLNGILCYTLKSQISTFLMVHVLKQRIFLDTKVNTDTVLPPIAVSKRKLVGPWFEE